MIYLYALSYGIAEEFALQHQMYSYRDITTLPYEKDRVFWRFWENSDEFDAEVAAKNNNVVDAVWLCGEGYEKRGDYFTLLSWAEERGIQVHSPLKPLTEKHMDILEQCLGLDRAPAEYKNVYRCSANGLKYPLVQDLVKRGLFEQRKLSEISRGAEMFTFKATQQGKKILRAYRTAVRC